MERFLLLPFSSNVTFSFAHFFIVVPTVPMVHYHKSILQIGPSDITIFCSHSWPLPALFSTPPTFL